MNKGFKAIKSKELTELHIINILKNNKNPKTVTNICQSNKTSTRNNSKNNKKERPSSHKTINLLEQKKIIKNKTMTQRKSHKSINSNINKNNQNEINIDVVLGSDSMNNNTNSYLNNTGCSKVTISYEDILKEKDTVISKLENELQFNRGLINKIKSHYNLNNLFNSKNRKIQINNISNKHKKNSFFLSKTKSTGNITTKRKNTEEIHYFFSSLLKNINKKSKSKSKTNKNINSKIISYTNLRQMNYNNNILMNNKNVKSNYNNYHFNIQKKNKHKKTNSCELIDKIKCLEDILTPHKKKNKNGNINSLLINNNNNINWEKLCDDVYNKTKSALEKCKKILEAQLKNDKYIKSHGKSKI